jgi:hypothetical protein
VKDRTAQLDVVTLGGSPEQAGATLRASAQKWAPVVKRTGPRLD